MKRGECEIAIRHLATQWAKATGFDPSSGAIPSFSSFKEWASQQGYSAYFQFRSRMGADYDAEAWFDQELKQYR